MALAVMLSGQTYISLMDRIDHAHHHAHFANPLAGDIQFCAGDHCGAHHHHEGAQTADAHADGEAHHHAHGGPTDHQHGDAALVFLAAQSFVLPASPMVTDPCEARPQTLVSFTPRGPDHPPKSGLAIRV